MLETVKSKYDRDATPKLIKPLGLSRTTLALAVLPSIAATIM